MRGEEAVEIAELTGLSERAVNDLVQLLAVVYASAEWRRITGRNRSSLDVFQHKVKAAAMQPTIPRFTEKLCHSLGLQSITVSPDLITGLDADRLPVLKALQRESIYWVLLAEQEVKRNEDCQA